MRKVMMLMTILFLAAYVGFNNADFSWAADSGEDQAVLKVVKSQSRTLNLFDADINAVRNLQVISFPEKMQRRDDKFVATTDYRDIDRGDVVTVEVLLVADGDSYAVEDTLIINVEQLKKEASEKKDYTDEEIQAFMKDYIEQQVKFTGSLMLYDDERQVMRNLKMNELKPEVRRMGIFYSSPSVFEDVDTGDILGIDIAVQNKDGQLELQALRIRSVKKGK